MTHTDIDRKVCEEITKEEEAKLGNKTDRTYTFREMIKFVMWYSGMKQEQIVQAYNRYLLEK